MRESLTALEREVTGCRLCPRLVAHREAVAQTKRRAYLDQEYWGRPVSGFGDPAARVVLIGLAPGAHGSNRTGRPFTGDASGNFLYPALHRAGFCSEPASIDRHDRLQLIDCWITAAVRCAPPDNRPTTEEFRTCQPFLQRELELLAAARVYIALGALALAALARALPELRSRRLRFAHGAGFEIERGVVLASYHPSQQNTQTGRLTAPMFDAIFSAAKQRLE